MTSFVCKPHILIRSYEADRDWLSYCLKSLERYAPGVGVTVVAPSGHDVGCPCVPVVPVHGDGYVDQQYTKLMADSFVPAGTTHVIHLDSDCVLIHPIEALFQDYKPILLKTPWKDIPGWAQHWRETTQRYLGQEVEFEYMRRQPLAYPIEIYARLREHLSRVHGGKTLYELIGNVQNRTFSEYNLLGAYADHWMHESFHWINTATEVTPAPVALQGWSYDGVDSVREQWEQAIHGGAVKTLQAPAPERVRYVYFEDTTLPDGRKPLEIGIENWRRHGWETVVLGIEHARQHPLWDLYHQTFAYVPTVNQRDYELACWHRWLAYATAIDRFPAIVSDHDIINQGWRPAPRSPAWGLILGESYSGVLSLTRDAVLALPGLMLALWPHAMNLVRGVGPHVSEMDVLSALCRRGLFERTIEACALADGKAASAPLVHCSHTAAHGLGKTQAELMKYYAAA